MNVLCTICNDLLNQYGDKDNTIYVTQCGHIFHQVCLVEWINRAETCPQCRSTVRHSSMFRLYLTFSPENDTVKQQQSCLDDLEQQIQQKLKELELQNQQLMKCNRSMAKVQSIESLNKKLKQLKQENEEKEKKIRNLDMELWLTAEHKTHQKSIATKLGKKLQDMSEGNEALRKTVETLNRKLYDLEQILQEKDKIVIDLSSLLESQERENKDSTAQCSLLMNNPQTSNSEVLGQTSDEPERPSRDLENETEAEINNNSVTEETATDEPNDSASINTPAPND